MSQETREEIVEGYIEKSKPLDLTVQVVASEMGKLGIKKKVLVGNSGLRFNIITATPETYQMHFTPEEFTGGYEKPRETKLKYSTVFCAAFNEFYEWWQEPKNFHNIPRPHFLRLLTNPTMKKSLEILFNEEEEIVKTIDPTIYNVDLVIDLEKIGRHPELVRRLRLSKERAERQAIWMRI